MLLTQQGLHPVLQVSTKAEGALRISCCATLILSVFVTGLAAVLWELLLWNLEDRDFRDMLFDHRVTSQGREYHHKYFKEPWWTVLNSDWPSVDLASNLSLTVPVMLLECGSGVDRTCESMESHVEFAMGFEPSHCARRNGLMWSSDILYTEDGDDRIRFFADGEELAEHQLVGSDSTSRQQVLDAVELVKSKVGDNRWVSPESWRYPRVQDSGLKWSRKSSSGGNRRKWGLEDDLSWFKTCPDTAWDANYFSGIVNITHSALVEGRSPSLPIKFNNREYSVPMYNVLKDGNQTAPSVQKLESLRIEVSATPCDAWRVSRIIPTWRHTVIQESSLNDEVGENKSVNVTMADFSAPHKLYVPKYGGQIYILVGVASAAFVGAGIITLMVSWAVIVWNVRVAAGKDTPWWAYTANRGW